MSWTQFKKFDDFFTINHYVGHPGREGEWKTSLEGVHGCLSMAEGLSPNTDSIFNYRNLKPDEIPRGVYWIRVLGNGKCSHRSKHFDYIGMAASRGGYSKFQQGIFGRMFDHYRKIVKLPERSKIGDYLKIKYPSLSKECLISEFSNQSFKDYNELRRYFIDPNTGESMIRLPKPFNEIHNLFSDQLNNISNIRKFFKNQVLIRYSPYPPSKTERELIAKGEGLALREYYHKYEEYPFLNTREETRGLEGFGDYGDLGTGPILLR